MSVIAPPPRSAAPVQTDNADALIREARLRQQRRRIRGAIGLVVVIAMAAVGYGIDRIIMAGTPSNSAAGASAQGYAKTKLTVVALNSWVGRAVFHLDCGPAGGDIPSPARACAALARAPRLVTNPRPFTCLGGTSSWWEVAISGRLNGKPIRRSFSTCWTPQMTTIGRLGLGWAVLRKHLVVRRVEAVTPGIARLFLPGDLRAADLVTCTIRGHHLQLGVPVSVGPPASTGFGGANVTSVTLSTTHNRDGSVSANCHTGNP
jgi:hypothetical protein